MAPTRHNDWTNRSAHYRDFLDAEPRTGCQLDPRLLFRHASTELYQEAHLEIERGPQSYFVGLAPIDRPKGIAPRDVRFTPANLARVLVEQAIGAYGPLPDVLVVLDPACGSGVFLQQCLRELTTTHFQGNVSLHGYDRSEISACIARFCLSGPVREALSPGLKADVRISQVDSLTTDPWAPAQLILMNPPFISRDYLAPDELASIKAVLGDELAKGRVDMAMAFIWKAINSIPPGGVVATVLPTGLLQSSGGRAWRDAIARICDVCLLGRFEGYKYFPTSIIETGFAVLRKRKSNEGHSQSSAVSVLVAQEGNEDAAIRFLRVRQQGVVREIEGIDLYEAKPEQVLNERWVPLRKEHYLLREWTAKCGLPMVESLFSVNMGVRFRCKPAFLLSSEEYAELPVAERRYFRPAAGQTTIVDGRLVEKEHVFYPYAENGLVIETEAELKQLVPTYLKLRLERFRSKLTGEQWWALVRPGTWQYGRQPKLVCKTFGAAGSFAFDETGDYAVVQGFAWRWKRPTATDSILTPIQFAYLALLNSATFNTLLSIHCRRIQGGQFELANRYVSSIPLPDLTKDDETTAGLVTELAAAGQRVHDEGMSSVEDDIDDLAIRAYALPEKIADAFVRSAEGEHARRP